MKEEERTIHQKIQVWSFAKLKTKTWGGEVWIESEKLNYKSLDWFMFEILSFICKQKFDLEWLWAKKTIIRLNRYGEKFLFYSIR